MTDMLRYFQSQKSMMLDQLDQLVRFETFTREKVYVDRMTDHMAVILADMGA